MTNQNPATPAQAATPGSDAQPVVPNSSGAAPASTTGAQGTQSGEGKVTIDLKEYRDLQRAKARTLSFDKRVNLRDAANQGQNPDGAGDQQTADAIARANAAERRAMQAEVRVEVRDLLDKDEFKALPKSTKELILKNPAMLSSAETKEEALIDIEEFVRDQVLAMEIPAGTSQGTAAPSRETPPRVTPGSPAPTKANELEDLSNLSGPARSQAAIRNAIKARKN